MTWKVNHTFNIIGVYAPNEDGDEFPKVKDNVPTSQEIIEVGDLNILLGKISQS